MIQFSTLCQPRGICLEVWGGHTQHQDGPTSHGCAAGCVRTICRSRADGGSLSGASAPTPAPKHSQRGCSNSPAMLPSPNSTWGHKGEQGATPSIPAAAPLRTAQQSGTHTPPNPTPGKRWKKSLWCYRDQRALHEEHGSLKCSRGTQKAEDETPTSAAACYEHPRLATPSSSSPRQGSYSVTFSSFLSYEVWPGGQNFPTVFGKEMTKLQRSLFIYIYI